MSEVREVECEICGVFFTTDNPVRKLCDKCSKDNNARRNMDRALARSKFRYRKDPKLITFNCEYCGKEHTISSSLLHKVSISEKSSWDGVRHYYCCTSHRIKAKHDHSVCSNCGKTLEGTDYGYSEFRADNYCCKECETEHKLKMGYFHKFTCEYCGKEVIKRQKGFFCSASCYNKAVKEGWKNPNKEPVSAKHADIVAKLKCANCGKEIERTFRNHKDYVIYASSVNFCSNECGMEFREKQRREQEFEKEFQESIKSFRKNGKKTKPSVVPLCTTCKTSYKDCERMQSEFRILPEGARLNMEGQVVKCPKFK